MCTQELISIIVPVYMVEKYLDQCVESIVNQTYQNLEIILIDDGSPDNCPAMCDAWAKRDSRVKVIHKSNGGGAQARNVGLDFASGKYIGFVDSDDLLLPQMYETLFELLKSTGCEIAECGYFQGTARVLTGGDLSDAVVTAYDTEQALLEHINDRVCRQIVWNKLYSAKTIGSIRFAEGRFIDDEFFTYRVLGQASRVVVTSRKFYYYRQRDDSIMHQDFSIKRLDALDAKCERIDYLRDFFPKLLPVARVNLFYTYLYLGQLALRCENNETKRLVLKKIRTIQTTYPLILKDFSYLSSAYRLWALLTKISLLLTCQIRNLLQIGD